MNRLSSSGKLLAILAFFSIVARLTFLPLLELLPEEAYYWNYSQHLAPGYLDHPPLNAWLISLGSLLIGHSEFAVRIMAFFCSCIAGFFVHRLAALIFDKTAAWISVSIFVLLPYFLGNSVYMSPDAGLVAAWAAALYLITSIVIEEQISARQNLRWMALGIAVGLGMLSKYTIVLLAISGFVTFISDIKLRHWFRRPAPFAALLLSILIFSPVLYWNAVNDWASFAFQSTRRLSEVAKFSFFDFIGHIIVVATPAGVIIALIFCLQKSILAHSETSPSSRAVRFLKISFLLPTLVFMFSSFQQQPRINWTGPAFLSLIPLFAAYIDGNLNIKGKYNAVLRRSFCLFLCISPLGYLLFWIYCCFGIPFMNFSPRLNKLIGWESLGLQVSEIREKLSKTDGKEPLIIGMDKHYTAAELAFYLRKARPDLPPPRIAGRSLFGMESLMFDYWKPHGEISGLSAILVARSKSDLEFPELTQQFKSLEPIHEIQAMQNGKKAGLYYYRFGFGFINIKSVKDFPAS